MSDKLTYSDGGVIPYVNYVGLANHFAIGPTILGTASLGFSAFYFYRLKFSKGAFLALAAYKWFQLASYLFDSDLIVNKKAQDIHSVMTYMPRNRIRRINELHSSIVNGTTGTNHKADIFAYINNDTRLAIHAAIGQNQQDPSASFHETTLYHRSEQMVNKQPITAYTSSDGFGFYHLPVWPKNQGGTITMLANQGAPKYIFGNLKDYYMNQDKLEISLNNGAWSPLTFGTDFGKYESRKFDYANANQTYDPQDFRGSLFFAPVNPGNFDLGENSVRVRVKSALGNNITARVTVINGKTVPVVETNAAGLPKSGGLLGQGMRLPAGTSKTLYFLINTGIQPTDPNTTIAIAAANGVINFTNSVNAPPQPGQFRFVSTATPDIYRIEINLPESMLAIGEDGSTKNPDQELIFHITDVQGQNLVKHLPFVIDQFPPVITTEDQYVVGDYNGDGIVDFEDVCHAGGPLIDPAQCQTICTDAGLTGADCTDAKTQCNQQAAQVAPGDPDCDGLDNDFDGVREANDINETNSLNYYSPKFDNVGKLLTPPVPISFTVTDNVSNLQPHPKYVIVQIQKVSDLRYNSTDPIVHMIELDVSKIEYGKNVSAFWTMEGQNISNLDGQYCYTVHAVDLAGTLGSDEGVSAPACFVVDTKAPSLSVVNPMQDDRGLGEYSKVSQNFSVVLRPTVAGQTGPFASTFDSPAENITIRFDPQGDKAALAPIEYEIPANYLDMVTQDAQGKITATTGDGKVDATIWSLQDYADLASTGEEEFALPDGMYQVQYIATDKGGNTTTIDGGMIQKSRGDAPPQVSAISGVKPSRNSSNNTTTYTGKIPTDVGQGDPWINIPVPMAPGKDLVQTLKLNTSTIQAGTVVGLDARQTGELVEQHIGIGLNQNGTIQVFIRPDGLSAGTITPVSGVFINTPVWVRVERKGSVVEVSYSTDGQIFTVVGSQTMGTGSLVVGPFLNGAPGSTITYTIPDADWVMGKKTANSASCGDALAIFSVQDMTLADRVKTTGQVRSNGAFELGADAVIQGNLYGGSSAFLRERAQIQGNAVIYGALSRQNGTVITGILTQGQALTSCSLPTLPSLTVGTQNVTVSNDQIIQLAPGNYGDVVVYSRATLKLRSGTYRFKSFQVDTDVKFELDARSSLLDVQVRDFMTLGDRFVMNTTAGSVPSLIQFTSRQTADLRLGTDSKFVGNLLAPNALVIINSRPNQQGQAQFYGRLQAKKVNIQPDSWLNAFTLP